jgi:hypothetical protein
MKLSVSLQLLDIGQPVWLLGLVISSPQGLYLYTNIEKRTHTINTKYPCPEWDSNTQSRHSRERRQFMPQTAQLLWPASVRASEDSSRLRPRSYCDRLASERAKTVHALDRSSTVRDSGI